jgi:hypothetical protein
MTLPPTASSQSTVTTSSRSSPKVFSAVTTSGALMVDAEYCSSSPPTDAVSPR